MVSKPDTFVIKVESKQINSKEELEPYCKDLIAAKSTVQNVTFTGNSYGFDACTRIAQILEECKLLKVS